MARWQEILATTAGIIATIEISKHAFTPDIGRQIFQRDKGTCQMCGKRFRGGWLLDIAHFDHDKNNPLYNDPSNGRVLCLADHLQDHLNIGDANGAYLIRRRIEESHGGRTRDWIAKNIK